MPEVFIYDGMSGKILYIYVPNVSEQQLLSAEGGGGVSSFLVGADRQVRRRRQAI